MRHLLSKKENKKRQDVKGYACYLGCLAACSSSCTSSCSYDCSDTCSGYSTGAAPKPAYGTPEV